MKLILVFISLSLLNASGSIYSQNVTFNLSVNEMTVKEVIRDIEKQSQYRFLYNDDFAGLNRLVSFYEKERNLGDLLGEILTGANLTYRELENDLIVLTPLIIDAQQITVNGHVTDASTGETLPGVSVLVVGTTIGTITDNQGNYSLTVPEKDAILSFSFVGYMTSRLPIEGRTVINVNLEQELVALEEVVAVGYGTMRKTDLTGSVQSISMDDIPPSANINITQALRGYAPGLNIQGGTKAGDEPSFSIRGQNTLSASSAPLIVLDGIIFRGSISDINIADVDRIDVLKDASASAVYGSRAANGVLLITTRKGNRTTKPVLSFNSYFGFQDMTNNPVKVMNAEQYVRKQIDYPYMQTLYAWYNQRPTSPDDKGGRPVYTEALTDQMVINVLRSEDEINNYLAGTEINWTDEVTRIAPISNYELSLGGGGDNFNYYISGAFTDQEGVLVNDQFNRTTLFGKVEGDVLDWMTLGLTTSYSHRDHSGLNANLSYARNTTPLASKYDEYGNYPQLYNNEFLMRHPLRTELVSNEDLRQNVFTTAFGRVRVPGISGLTYEFNYSENHLSRDNRTYYPTYVEEGASANGRAIIETSNSKNWIYNNILSYSTEFASDHRFNSTLVYTREKSSGKNAGINATNFTNELLGYNNLSFAGLVSTGTGAWYEYSAGYMARINYIFKDRYFLTGTFRRDGFSGFGEDRKWADFPSLSLAWTITEEAFVNAEWLYHLKLRASYGVNGNQGIGRYASLSRVESLYYVFGPSTSIGIGPSTLGNALLSWETTRSTNFGLDYILFNNRISGEIDIYEANTTDVLVRQALPQTTGFSDLWNNIGEINNRGIELGLNTLNVEGQFRWDSRFVFALNRDKIINLYGDNSNDIGNQWFIGEPISAIYDYQRSGGLWTEEELFTGSIHQSFNPGQFRLVDIDGDNRITPGEDRTIVGYATPNYRFSIGNNFYYKNFVLSVLLNSIQGGNGYFIQNNRGLLEATSDFDYANRINMPAIRENWTPLNGVDNAPAIFNYPPRNSGNYQDRSFVRLQDLSLTYRFSQNILNNINMQGLQLFISGKNLYTWTKWEGYDPEGGANEGYGGSPGSATQMMMRSLIFGVRVSY